MEKVHTIVEQNGYLPLSSAINVASTCHGLQDTVTDESWEQSLRDHFPSHYMLHQESYKQKKDVSWKNEYKVAHQSLSLRYMDGVNLQQSKVLHFGPTLEKQVVVSILNQTDGFYLESEDQISIFEGNSYYVSKTDPALIVSKEPVTAEGYEGVRAGIVLGTKLFVTSDEERKYYMKCYDIEAKKLLWKQETGGRSQAYFVVLEEKLFYVGAYGVLVCLDTSNGQTLFHVTPTSAAENESEESDENPKKKRKGEVVPAGKQIAIDGDYAVWLINLPSATENQFATQLTIAVANWKTQKMHGTYNLHNEFDDHQVSRFSVVNGRFYVNVIPAGTDIDSHCIAVDLQLNSTNPEITKLWKFTRPEGGMEDSSDVAPCVYGDLVFSMFYYFTDDDDCSWLVALDANSGKLVWRWRFNPGETDDVNQLNPYDLYVIEGTASIAERQALREARKSGKATQFRSKKDSEANEDEEEEENEDEEEGDEEEGESKKDKIKGNVKKGKDTTFPILRFSLQNNNGSYFEGAAIAETGELLFFKKHEKTIPRCYDVVAISKHQKPQHIVMTP